jgi:hypothetical protein
MVGERLGMVDGSKLKVGDSLGKLVGEDVHSFARTSNKSPYVFPKTLKRSAAPTVNFKDETANKE